MAKNILSLLIILAFSMMTFCGCSTSTRETIAPNHDAITGDLTVFATKAQQFYHKPADLGGGGNSFERLTADEAGISILASKEFWDNKNGRYSIMIAGTAQQVVILCVGKMPLSDGSFPRYTCTVSPVDFKIYTPK